MKIFLGVVTFFMLAGVYIAGLINVVFHMAFYGYPIMSLAIVGYFTVTGIIVSPLAIWFYKKYL